MIFDFYKSSQIFEKFQLSYKKSGTNDDNSHDGYIWKCRSRVLQHNMKFNKRKKTLYLKNLEF